MYQKIRNNKNECCGCRACLLICPKNAIHMESDSFGFEYPIIDNNRCVHCGLCEKVCSFGKPLSPNKADQFPICYAAKNNSLETRIQSRSGGIFTAISDLILDDGGSIYGASLDKDFVVRHHRAVTKKARNEFRKSKYVQSEIGECFKTVEKDLASGISVLFSGTPCQCDAVKMYLELKRIDTSKLLLVDIVCHGVPSPLMFKRYLEWIERKERHKITDYEFRVKNQKYKWSEGVERIVLENNKTIYQDNFVGDLFYYAENTRLSCHYCKYTSLDRVSDITLGDFWGIEKVDPSFNDQKGVSLILLNTSKGLSIFEKTEENFECFNTERSKVIQPALESPCLITKRYYKLWDDFVSLDNDNFFNRYTHNSYSKKSRALMKVKKIVFLPLRAFKKVVNHFVKKRK